jgi:Raf kinase inhibitor-like YbhB/YbcL family protein
MARWHLVQILAAGALAAIALAQAGCKAKANNAPEATPDRQASESMGAAMKLTVTSASFEEGQPIPAAHAYQNQNLSPPLAWAGPPAQTKSLAVICDDPDAPAGTWVHWVLYNIPPGVTSLKQGLPKSEKLTDPAGASQGPQDFGAIGYDGPAPPSGVHRYYFKVYALDLPPTLKPGLDKPALLSTIKGHVLAEGAVMGTYRH